jgi:hypothetical protein
VRIGAQSFILSARPWYWTSRLSQFDELRRRKPTHTPSTLIERDDHDSRRHRFLDASVALLASVA